MPKKTAEYVCIEYAQAVAEVRRLTKVMSAMENFCTIYDSFGVLKSDSYYTESCVQRLFVKREWEDESEEDYQERLSGIRAEMCSGCRRVLKAIEDRKAYRIRLGSVKRSVESVGKRLQKEGTHA